MNSLETKRIDKRTGIALYTEPFHRFLRGVVRCAPTRSKYQTDLIVFEKRLYPGVREDAWFNESFHMRRPTQDDFDQIRNHPERPIADVYDNRLADGHSLFCVVLNEEVTAFVWFNFEIMCHFYGTKHCIVMGRLPKDTGYLYDIYTFTKYRGLGLSTALLQYAQACLANSGVSYLRACVSPLNVPPILLYKKENYIAIDLIHLYRILGMKKCFRASMRELRTLLHGPINPS